MPQGPFVEENMTKGMFMTTLKNMTQLVMDQAHIVNNHFVGKANQVDRPQPNSSTPSSRIRDLMRMNPPT